MRRINLWVPVLLYAAIVVAWADAPHQRPNQPSEKSTNQIRGTTDTPIYIKILKSDKSPEEIASENAERQRKAAADAKVVDLTANLAFYTKLLFLATAALAAVTGGLVVVGFFQVRDAKRIIAAANLSASAADKSASAAERALTILERPFVYGNVSKPGLAIANLPWPRVPELGRSELELCIYNFGRSPATLTRLEYTIAPAPTGSIIAAIDPAVVGGRELPVGTISAKGDPFFETSNLGLRFVDEAHEIVSGLQSVWLTGFIRYDDIFGQHHITGFTLVFDRIGGRFVRRGGDLYNYARQEEGREIPPPTARN